MSYVLFRCAQIGAVSVQLGPLKPSGGSQLPLPSITLQHSDIGSTYSRFGWATAALDLNSDGIEDLVVSSPTWGWDWADIAVSPLFM